MRLCAALSKKQGGRRFFQLKATTAFAGYAKQSELALLFRLAHTRQLSSDMKLALSGPPKLHTVSEKKRAHVTLSFTITDPVQQLVPMLLGCELMFGHNPKTVFENMRLSNEQEVLAFLKSTGFVVSGANGWKLSNSVKKHGLETMTPMPRNRSELPSDASKSGVRCLDLLRRYKDGLEQHKTHVSRATTASLLAWFRRLCKQFGPVEVSSSLGTFLTKAALSGDFRLEAFQKFLSFKQRHGGSLPREIKSGRI